MLCAPLDWQYAELPSSASDAVLCLCSFVRCGTSKTNRKKKNENEHRHISGRSVCTNVLVNLIIPQPIITAPFLEESTLINTFLK